MINIIIKFLKLSPIQSFILMVFSVISGILQSLTALSFVPLAEFLGLTDFGDNPITENFKTISEFWDISYTLINVLVFLVLLVISIALIDFFTKSYSARTFATLVRRMRLKAVDSTLSANWSFFTGKKTGEFVHTLVTESSKASAGYMDTISFISATIQSFVMMVTTFLIDVNVAMASLISGLLILYFFKGWIEKARVASKKTNRSLQKVVEITNDGMLGIKPLKAMNRDYLVAPLLNTETKNLELLQYRMYIVTAVPLILRGPFIVVIMALGLYIVIDQSLLPLVNVIPMALLFQRLASNLGVTQTSYQTIKKMEPYLISFEENINKADSMKETWTGLRLPVFKNDIQFKNVSFSYDDKLILNNSHFYIKKNEFITLVGPSGIGKTTVLDILIGLYTPSSGYVLIDGINIMDLDINKWRSSIGYVPQDSFLFHDTIANNISLADPKINTSMIENAIEAAGASEFVSELPDGLQTSIGERGLKLSGGQRQRISIARAMVSKPQLLVLDEATTALDPSTEKNILSTLRNLLDGGITIIAVSHQSAVLEVADRAFHLENCKLVPLSEAKN